MSSSQLNNQDEWNQLEELNTRYRRYPGDNLANELAQLRYRIGARMCQESPVGEPQAFDTPMDLFPDCSGLPEISAEKLNASTLAAGIHHHGALLVRSLFSEQQVQRLLSHKRTEASSAPDSGLPLGCTPAELFDLLDIYQQSGLLNVFRTYLSDEPVLFGERAKLRQHQSKRDRSAVITWHQDAAFFGTGCQGVNCWAGITACGMDNPGLALIPRRFDELLCWKGDELAPLDYGKRMPEGLIEKLSQGHPAQFPMLQPGDALLFDTMTLHSTAVRPWNITEQIVAISWFFRASAFPDWGTPLAV